MQQAVGRLYSIVNREKEKPVCQARRTIDTSSTSSTTMTTTSIDEISSSNSDLALKLTASVLSENKNASYTYIYIYIWTESELWRELGWRRVSINQSSSEYNDNNHNDNNHNDILLLVVKIGFQCEQAANRSNQIGAKSYFSSQPSRAESKQFFSWPIDPLEGHRLSAGHCCLSLHGAISGISWTNIKLFACSRSSFNDLPSFKWSSLGVVPNISKLRAEIS